MQKIAQIIYARMIITFFGKEIRQKISSSRAMCKTKLEIEKQFYFLSMLKRTILPVVLDFL